MTALPLPNKLHISAQKSVKHRTLTAQFGDGYSQRVPDGINSKTESWSIMWPALTAAEYSTVSAALDTAGSSGVLTWTPPLDSTAKKFVMTNDGYRVDLLGGFYRVSCGISQVFEP